MPISVDPWAAAQKHLNGIVPIYQEITNYIYLYHVNKLIWLPNWPDNLMDSSTANFQSSSPLGRSAPIWSYSNSGPRSISFQFELHREMLDQVNGFEPGSSANIVDELVKQVQAAVLPTYASSSKMIDPPLVACRVGNDIFIKGIINGAVSVAYSGPILYNDKYALVNVGFTITEVDPYDAETVQNVGSFRYSNDIPIKTNLSSPIYSVQQTGGVTSKGGSNYLTTGGTRFG